MEYNMCRIFFKITNEVDHNLIVVNIVSVTPIS